MTAALEGGEWSAARPGRTLPPEKIRYPLYRRLGGPQGRSGRAENLVPTGIRSRTVQPVVSRYTDWATEPTNKICRKQEITKEELFNAMEQSPSWEANNPQLVKKFTALYVTRRFITASTSVRHPSLSWARSIQSTPPHITFWRAVLISSFHLSLGLRKTYSPLFAQCSPCTTEHPPPPVHPLNAIYICR